MFSASNYQEYIDIKQILPTLDQESLFIKYAGITPNENNFHSLFRSDKNPGCRFKWHSGILYFVDNATFNGKLYFNIVDVISILFNLTIKEAIHKIISENKIDVSLHNYKLKNTNYSKPKINIKSTNFENDNYFKITPYQLRMENVFKIDTYWINIHGQWEINKLYNPKKVNTYGYYFPDTDNIKLYFPNQNIRFFTNCNEHDIYGLNKLPYYYDKNDSHLIITKSQKDRLLLDYMYGYNAIAVQSETSVTLREDVIRAINKFKQIYILFDYDETGIKYADKLALLIPNTNVIFLQNAKDVYDSTLISVNTTKNELCQKIILE
jgi:5S rRNA maturation endonuclease (ribonuclease M5)